MGERQRRASAQPERCGIRTSPAGRDHVLKAQRFHRCWLYERAYADSDSDPDREANLTVLAVDRVNANRETVRIEFEPGLDHPMWLADVTSKADLDVSPEDFDFGAAEGVVTLCTCSYLAWGNERTLVYCSIELLP